jgi:hypothetical protein
LRNNGIEAGRSRPPTDSGDGDRPGLRSRVPLGERRVNRRPVGRGEDDHYRRWPNKAAVVMDAFMIGKIVRTGASYHNRFISVVTIEDRKIVQWRDYMDSLAAMTALSASG